MRYTSWSASAVSCTGRLGKRTDGDHGRLRSRLCDTLGLLGYGGSGHRDRLMAASVLICGQGDVLSSKEEEVGQLQRAGLPCCALAAPFRHPLS